MRKRKSETRLLRDDVWLKMIKQKRILSVTVAGFLFLWLLMVMLSVFKSGSDSRSKHETTMSRKQLLKLESEQEWIKIDAPVRPVSLISPIDVVVPPPQSKPKETKIVSGLGVDPQTFADEEHDGSTHLRTVAKAAWKKGRNVWNELENVTVVAKVPKENMDECPLSLSISGSEFSSKGGLLELPCGLTLGSHLTVVGKPLDSQFILELQGLKTVDGEVPPKILHFNPRIKGDWSKRPIIELNTCYRQQWGIAQRCEGERSIPEEETVDGQAKCEKWSLNPTINSEEPKGSWWLSTLMGRTKKVDFDWSFPFEKNKDFVLTLSAGLEGYHIIVDGRHVTSFPYRTGYTLEDATGVMLAEDIDVHHIYAASLPTAHPNFSPDRFLEMSDKFKAPPLSEEPTDLFIGVLSAGNHFAERMAVRKSWMQHHLIQSSKVAARFFVALHPKQEVNLELKKEAEFFGDVVVVPYMDNYDLVVLKTIAICEFGVRTVGAKYIMKGDDDTFVRVDSIMGIAEWVPQGRSFYIGNINYYHRPLRHGKWAVTYEEWPEEAYPSYANGPGYIFSSDIANFIVTQFENHKLRLFKMEDVSMGMWVEQYNKTGSSVLYAHSWKFCQFGCVEGYYTAHYQSPKQMICLWQKLERTGKPQCCNMR